MKDYIKKTLEELEVLDNVILNKKEFEELPNMKKFVSIIFNAYKNYIKEKLEGIENLQRCDCCGKLKSGKFICGTCEDCI